MQVNLTVNYKGRFLGSCSMTVIDRVTALYRAVIYRFDYSTMHILNLDADREFGRELNFRPSCTAGNKRETKTTFQRLLYKRTCPAELGNIHKLMNVYERMRYTLNQWMSLTRPQLSWIHLCHFPLNMLFCSFTVGLLEPNPGPSQTIPFVSLLKKSSNIDKLPDVIKEVNRK